MNKICVHNFGGTKRKPRMKTSMLSEADINEAHRNVWPDFPSVLNGSYIGYNIIIWKDGSFTQHRYIGEETAAQRGNNKDTVSICLAGNFTKGVEVPSLAQIAALKDVIRALVDKQPERLGLRVWPNTVLDFSMDRLYPHRHFNPYTACYGSGLKDSWIKGLFFNRSELMKKISLLRRMIELIQKLIQLKRLGTRTSHCLDDARG